MSEKELFAKIVIERLSRQEKKDYQLQWQKTENDFHCDLHLTSASDFPKAMSIIPAFLLSRRSDATGRLIGNTFQHPVPT